MANSKSVFDAVTKANPDHIFHLAAESHVDRSINNPEIFVDSNIKGTFNILESARTHYESLNNQKKEFFKFQHISTDEVFGTLGRNGFFTEISNYDPRSPYSASKAASDHLVRAWHYTYRLPILITNCSNNYGPWQFPEKLIPMSIIKGLKNIYIPIYGDGENVRDWLFIDDHIEAILLVAKKGCIGSSYCIGGLQNASGGKIHNEISNNLVVNTICQILDKIKPENKPHAKLIKYVQDRPGHDLRYAIDSSKINEELGWQPKCSFEKGLVITVKWYAENLSWCSKMLQKSGYDGSRLGL